jgi:hypothetical protein
MTFTVRKSRTEDATAIAFVHVESWKTTYAGIVPDAYLASLSFESRTEKWKEQFQSGTTLIFVVEDASGIFGFASGGELREPIEGYNAEPMPSICCKQSSSKAPGNFSSDNWRKLCSPLASTV